MVAIENKFDFSEAITLIIRENIYAFKQFTSDRRAT